MILTTGVRRGGVDWSEGAAWIEDGGSTGAAIEGSHENCVSTMQLKVHCCQQEHPQNQGCGNLQEAWQQNCGRTNNTWLVLNPSKTPRWPLAVPHILLLHLIPVDL